MKNEEAIAILEEFKVIDDWTMVHLPPMEDAVDKAIEALKAKTDVELIGRQSVVRLLVEKYKFTTAEATEILDELPSAEPKKGKWIQDDDYICDQCGYHMIVGGGAYNYCPNCGADMRGEEE